MLAQQTMATNSVICRVVICESAMVLECLEAVFLVKASLWLTMVTMVTMVKAHLLRAFVSTATAHRLLRAMWDPSGLASQVPSSYYRRRPNSRRL